MPESKKHQDNRHKEITVKKANSRLMEAEGERRSGSASNAHSGRKQHRLHENHESQNRPLYDHPDPAAFDDDLHAGNLAGARSAADVKELYGRLADLTDDEMKNVLLVPEGNRLEQGARYIDLAHLENGEFVATAEMIAEPGHYYVPKKSTDYVLWNRLNQVDVPERLDER